MTNPGAQFGAYQQIKAQYDGQLDMEVFTDMPAARAWLGLPEE